MNDFLLSYVFTVYVLYPDFKCPIMSLHVLYNDNKESKLRPKYRHTLHPNKPQFKYVFVSLFKGNSHKDRI